MGSDGAVCYTSITHKQMVLSKPIWDAERYGQLCTSPQTFSDWKAAIEILCSESGDCSYETQQTLEGLLDKLQQLPAVTRR